MRPSSHPVVSLPLRIVAAAYGAVLRARNRYYDRPASVRRAPTPVLSVGNLTVGGTGKTPMVGWLVGQLLALGSKPAIVSRGYGGTAGRGPRIVSEGRGPLCDAAQCGDEPYLLARSLAGVPIVVGSDRWAAATAAARMGIDVVVLDDGFQHRALARDLDLVLLDAGDPFGGSRLLPAGLLREPLCSLRRADLVLITRSLPGESHDTIERVVRQHNREAPVLRAGHRRIGFFDAAGRAAQPPARVVAFCGIGNPSSFRSDLESEGVEIVGFEAQRDHHPYRAAEVRRLQSLAASRDAVPVTTEKDRVRLPEEVNGGDGPPILTLRIEAEVFDPEPLLAAVRRVLGRADRR